MTSSIFGGKKISQIPEEDFQIRGEPAEEERTFPRESPVLGRNPQDDWDQRGERGDDDDEDGEEFGDIVDNTALLHEEEWKPVKVRNARPPHPLTVTHVNQSYDLKNLASFESALNAEYQSSEEWLKNHSIECLKLTLEDLVDRGKIGKLKPDHKTGKVGQHIQFDSYDVNEFEYKLNISIEAYTKRIKWLLQGSKRVFGNVKGKRVAVCVDTSDANTGFGRLTTLQELLIHLIDEQIANKEAAYFLSFGSEPEPLWPVMRDINCRIIEEAKEWVLGLQSKGGCNVLKAIKHIMRLKNLDMVLLILGSVPDQTPEILCDYVHQLAIGRNIQLHTVSYDSNNHLTNVSLRNLAEASEGRYHCYSAACEEQIYTGTDISLILKEIQRAQEIINRIKEMRQGMMGSALVSIMDEISTEVAKLPQSRFLPRPPGHDLPLQIDTPKFQTRSSADWLKQHGLKAKRLDLYQVLAPNAYSFKEDFIPVIKKAVQSQVLEKAMVQFDWHDGSVKNVHVDMTQLFEYQKQLGAEVALFERRMDWLASGSRRIMGTIVEKNVVILVDLSVSNINYLVHIQHSLRLLMEQQLCNKDYFNIMAFGSKAQAWKPTMMKPTPENMQSAWRWVLELQCGGSRNFMSAFKTAVENEEEIKHNINVQGVYLFTSGVPDQSCESVCSFVEEACCGRDIRLHTILFNVDDYDAAGAIPGRYANITKTSECLRNMAHCTYGRFHWFRESGIIESDDIQEITAEIDKALNFSRKCQILVDSVKKKYKQKFLQPYMTEIRALPPAETPKMKALPAPRQPAIRSSRQPREDEEQPRSILRRPASARVSNDVQRRPILPRQRPTSAKDPMERVRSKRVITSSFFMDNKVQGDGTGTVFKKYPTPRSVRKGVVKMSLPEVEEGVSTKEWMKLYSLSKLKLDLNKLVSGPDCKHKAEQLKHLNKHISAKYCDIFPTVNIKGTVKHLQLQPHELRAYEDQVERVLKRYLKRLQWLLTGSRRIFGTVVHKRCVFLIDTSGSMEPYMQDLKKELASLIWDQLYKGCIQFNIIKFSGECEKWRGSIVRPLEENCHDAVKWTSEFVARGNTCTLEALKLAFRDPNIDAVYLLTDGKPDTSTAKVLREIAEMNTDRLIEVNTISFNCDDSTANNFLRLLAAQTGGRYHRCYTDFDAQLFAHKLLTEGFTDTEHPHLPDFEGEDLRRLGSEISLARKYLAQARQFRAICEAKTIQTDRSARGTGPQSFTVGKGARRSTNT
ncbi:hypothetical protein ScPMuIL_004230 [Solemya velum]